MKYNSDILRHLHEELKEILREVVRVCEEANIPYFIQGGTAIGSHFFDDIVPWDDDIDLGMTRENYERFLKEAPALLNEQYTLQEFTTEPNTPFYFAKVRKVGTRFVESEWVGLPISEGVYIDIFPYDLVDGDQDVISARPAYCAVAGGLIGYGGYLDMSDCTVDCQIGKGKRPMAAWAGMVGFLVRPFRLKDSSVHLHGYFQRVTTFKMNRAVLAVVPCKSGSKEADVAGSQITGNLAISGCLYTSGSTLSSDDKSDLSASLTTKVFGDLDKAKAYLVAGEGFTANAGVDFTSANITYSAQ